MLSLGGSFSAVLARQLGMFLNIYPAKGYSITVPVKNEEAAFNVSLTDDEYKLVYSRLGDRMRVAGTAELNGYRRDLNFTRCRAIVRRAAEVMPEAGYWDQAEFWTGLRPATPSNVPTSVKATSAICTSIPVMVPWAGPTPVARQPLWRILLLGRILRWTSPSQASEQPTIPVAHK